jgi:hypothetical protein
MAEYEPSPPDRLILTPTDLESVAAASSTICLRAERSRTAVNPLRLMIASSGPILSASTRISGAQNSVSRRPSFEEDERGGSFSGAEETVRSPAAGESSRACPLTGISARTHETARHSAAGIAGQRNFTGRENKTILLREQAVLDDRKKGTFKEG